MALVKGLRENTPFLKSLTKRPPKTIEEIQERSHDYLQQDEGQSAVKTDRDKRETGRKDLSREDCSRREQRSGTPKLSQVEKIPAPRAIKNNNRGDRNAYCKYHKQNGHDTEDYRDLLEFIEKGLKKGKFREYTGRGSDRRDDRRTRHMADSPERKNDSKEVVVRREIKMISGGLPDEGNPPSRKAAKMSK
ncbi:hypothetical protein PIB30_020531 [Stylosanthes scabra]|uniref:Uncharacterized protein n=1 Tax=Stylosanthes scabra TaxID=79078 RepID=A0ABU6Y6V0_9FABA|nr:hypothetical protein [Stylosanthes scabra]